MRRFSFIFLILFYALNSFSQEVAVQNGHASTIHKLRFAPDGKTIASASADHSVILWDLQTGLQSLKLKGHNAEVNDISFNSDGTIIVSCSDDGKVIVWNAITGKEIRSIVIGKAVKAVTIDPKTGNIFCASEFIFEIKSDETIAKPISGKSKYLFNAINISSDGNYLAYGGKYDPVKILLVTGDNIAGTIQVKAHDLFFNGTDLLISGKTGRVLKYSLETGSFHKKFNKNSSSVLHAFYGAAADENNLLAVNKTGFLTLFNYKTGKKSKDIKLSDGELRTVAVSPDKKIIATAGADKRIVLLSTTDYSLITVLKGSAERISNISFSEDGKNMFIGYENGDMKYWDLSPGGKIIYNRSNLKQKKYSKNWKSPIVSSPSIISSNRILVKQEFTKYFSASPDTMKRMRNNLIVWDLERNEILKIRKTDKEIISGNEKAWVSSNWSFMHPAARNQRRFLTYIVPYFSLKFISLFAGSGTIFQLYRVFAPGVYYLDNRLKPSKYSSLNTIKKTNKHFNKHKKTVLKPGGDKVLNKEIKFRTVNSKGTHLATVYTSRKFRSESNVIVSNVENGQTLRTVKFLTPIINAALSSSGELIALESDGYLYVFDVTSGTQLLSKPGSFPITFNQRENKIIYTNDSGEIISSTIDGKILFSVNSNHVDKITCIKYNPTYDFFATSSFDGTVKFWDEKTGGEMVTVLSVGREEYIFVTPQNYYYSSKGALSGLGFRMNNKIFSFDQFDTKFNRPDIVLQTMPFADDKLIHAYKNAYVKRLSLLGMDSTQVSASTDLPEVKVKGVEKSLRVESPEFKFSVTALDKKSKLKDLQVLVDGVPLYGKDGVSLNSTGVNTPVEKEITLTLSPGTNRIQLFVTNEKGAASFKETFNVNYNAPVKTPDLYIVSIGSSKFIQNDFNLNYASKDANDVAKLFGKSDNFKNVHSKVLLDDQVTKENIASLSEFYSGAKESDVVVFFFAGHGLLDDKLNYYLSAYNIDFSRPSEKGIPYEMIDQLFEGVKSRKKLLFIDACHSGEVDKSETEITTAKNTEEGQVQFRNVGNSVKTQNAIGMKNTLEVSKSLFADLRKSNGSTVISSAGGAEYAMEGDQWKNGIFTYCLINGLKNKKADQNKDKKITVAELQKYLFVQVPALTDGKQSPTSRIENISNNFRIW